MYLPSSPLYARIPESTLTPAPVNSATFPDERKLAIRCAASSGSITGVGNTDESTLSGIVGIEMRIL